MIRLFKKLNIGRAGKGFTVIEVLVSTAIFAIIMVITTGIVAQSSTYRTKLKTMREVNEETRMLADQITRDIRSANASLAYGVSPTDPTAPEYNFKNGLALFSCDINGNCAVVNYSLGSAPSNANVLAISTKEGIKIYTNSYDGKTIRLRMYPPRTVLLRTDILPLGGSNEKVINNSTNTEAFFSFNGYCPQDGVDAVWQPYVQFIITSKTLGYDNLPVNQKAIAILRSIVTSRSYNN